MKKPIELLNEYRSDNAEEIEYMDVENPELDNLLKENEELLNAVKILKASERLMKEQNLGVEQIEALLIQHQTKVLALK